MKISFRWQPGQLIPIVMVLTLVAEALTRFQPMAGVATRGTWEAAIRYSFAADVEAGRFGKRSGPAGRLETAIDPRDPRQGSFEINLNLENRHAFGNLASIGNFPAHRHYHVEDFITDEFGFRNRPGDLANRSPDAIVSGSSFIAQPGVVHDQTLPAQLAARSGLRVYNAATSGGDSEIIGDFLGFIRRTAGRLGMHHGFVILDYKAGEDYCFIQPEMTESARLAALASTASPVADATRPWAAGVRRWLAISRLKIVAQRAYKSLQNDWFLPNIYSNKIVRRSLPDGQVMLFQPSGNPNVLAIGGPLEGSTAPSEPADDGLQPTDNDSSTVLPRPESLIEEGVAYFKWLNAQLARDGLTMVVLFVPRPVVIYGELVKPPLPTNSWVDYYRTLQVRLEAEGIAVVNPIEPLRREARVRVPRGEYLYHLDDTHWNAQGIAVTVDEILRVVPSTLRSRPPTADR